MTHRRRHSRLIARHHAAHLVRVDHQRRHLRVATPIEVLLVDALLQLGGLVEPVRLHVHAEEPDERQRLLRPDGPGS